MREGKSGMKRERERSPGCLCRMTRTAHLDPKPHIGGATAAKQHTCTVRAFPARRSCIAHAECQSSSSNDDDIPPPPRPHRTHHLVAVQHLGADKEIQ